MRLRARPLRRDPRARLRQADRHRDRPPRSRPIGRVAEAYLGHEPRDGRWLRSEPPTPVLACEGLVGVGYDRLGRRPRHRPRRATAARCWPSSGPTAPGRPRCCSPSPGSCKPLGGTMPGRRRRRVRPGSARRMNARRRRARARLPGPLHRAHHGGEPAASPPRRAGHRSTRSSTCSRPCSGGPRCAAGMLSGGEQQMLAVARALVQRPAGPAHRRDEHGAGAGHRRVADAGRPRRSPTSTDAAVVLVEQHVHLALEVADTAMVLVHGDVALTGDAQQVRAEAEALEAAYLGVAPAADARRPGSSDRSSRAGGALTPSGGSGREQRRRVEELGVVQLALGVDGADEHVRPSRSLANSRHRGAVAGQRRPAAEEQRACRRRPGSGRAPSPG